ncbi:MAG: hypothetical protein RR945_09505, partial [Erysipelotrichaceae bacterium]
MNVLNYFLNRNIIFSYVASLNVSNAIKSSRIGNLDVIVTLDTKEGEVQSGRAMYVNIVDEARYEKNHLLDIGENNARELHLEMNTGKHTLVLSDGDGVHIPSGNHHWITYRLDGITQKNDQVDFHFDANSKYHKIEIMVSEMKQASLEIFKTRVNENGEQMNWNIPSSFTMHLVKQGFKKSFQLSERNDFTYTMEGLDMGTYELKEDNAMNKKFSYQFDNGTPTSNPWITLSAQQHQCKVIEVVSEHNTLVVEKMVRDAYGSLIKPTRCCFKFRLLSNAFEQVYELNEQNNYTQVIEDLPCGLMTLCGDHASENQTSYIVNEYQETMNACFEVSHSGTNHVLIIDSQNCKNERECGSGLRIKKVIRGDNGCLNKPCICDSFKCIVKGCGTCDIFNLNASNNWCVDLNVACAGYYEICEAEQCDYYCEYIINGGSPLSNACIQVDGISRDEVIIVNEVKSRGRIKISKLLKNENGDLICPEENMCLNVTLKSSFFQETYILNKKNNWCVSIDNLRLGSYEVKEQYMEGYCSFYLVNGTCMKNARVILEDNKCFDVMIVNEELRSEIGMLTICKYLKTVNCELVKPTGNECYEVSIRGKNDVRSCILNADNLWSVHLCDLKEQTYQICEVNQSGFVAYLVNGNETCEAVVTMKDQNQEVVVINEEEQRAELNICVWMRYCDDQLCIPNEKHGFQVLVEGRNFSCEALLCEENNWNVNFDDLPQGKYRIYQKDDYGYRLSYQIDGCEKQYAKVTMCKEDIQVNIINTLRDCYGKVSIHKCISENGELLTPDCEMNYEIQVTGRRYKKCFNLNAENKFEIDLDDLEAGNYEVIELHENPIYFMINGIQKKNGTFCVGSEPIKLVIINEEEKYPELIIDKYIRDESGNLNKPIKEEEFEIVIEGMRYREYFTLSCENNWRLCLTNLCSGAYHIGERECGYSICFLKNDCPQETSEFFLDKEDITMSLINEYISLPCVQICKLIKDECGEYVQPKKEERFEVMIQGDGFIQRYELNHHNNFTKVIDDLPCGSYQIKEAYDPNYDVSFRINDNECESGEFIVDQDDIEILVINQDVLFGEVSICACRLLGDEISFPNQKDIFHIDFDNCEELVLCCDNNFSLSQDQLKYGTYVIDGEKDGYKVFYEINGCIQETGTFILNQDVNCIRLLYEKISFKGSLNIDKYVMIKGSMFKPNEDEVFNVSVIGENYQKQLRLNQANNWSYQLIDLVDGKYEVNELGDNKVTYIVNGGEESVRAIIMIAGNENKVKILNHKEGTKGSIELCKWIRDQQHQLNKPVGNASYRMLISGPNYNKTIVLDQDNNWCETIDQLNQGSYVIVELDQEDVTYIINGGSEVDKAVVSVNQNSNEVMVINNPPLVISGSIELLKQIRDASDQLVLPSGNVSYRVRINGQGFNKIIALDHDNNWHTELDNLTNGSYVIDELDEEDVSYIVNGGNEVNHAVVFVENNENGVLIINPEQVIKHGRIRICKYKRLNNGQLVRPSNQDTYEVHVSSTAFNEVYELNYANDWCVLVENLITGSYVLSEVNHHGEVSYRINGGSEVDYGVVDVNQNENSVMMINTSCNQQKDQMNDFQMEEQKGIKII